MRVRLKVREIAEAKGYDRAKLARQSDLTYETVHLIWKNPYRKVTVDTLLKLAHTLEVDLKELYEEEEDE